jgi:hypothetical protein
MRRCLGLLLGCVVATLSASGCHHVAGVCDCAPGGHHCYYGVGGHYSHSGIAANPADEAAPVAPVSHSSSEVMSKVDE